METQFNHKKTKILIVTADYFIGWLKAGEHHYKIIDGELPSDAKVIGMLIANQPNRSVETISLIIHSESFPEVDMQAATQNGNYPKIVPMFVNLKAENSQQ